MPTQTNTPATESMSPALAQERGRNLELTRRQAQHFGQRPGPTGASLGRARPYVAPLGYPPIPQKSRHIQGIPSGGDYATPRHPSLPHTALLGAGSRSQ